MCFVGIKMGRRQDLAAQSGSRFELLVIDFKKHFKGRSNA
jgi:hypothetical protein